MELIFWWMPLVWLVAIIAVVLVVVLIRRRTARRGESLPVAHSERLTALPSYRRALGRYRGMLVAFGIVVLILLLSSVGLSSRVARTTLVYPQLNDRDIVLCLDVSGSMVDYDKQLLVTFGELAKKFTGERISLVLFNASAVTYFPLTSDYDYMSAQFTKLEKEFDSKKLDYYSGTLFGDGSSLIGDGLASCTQKFDAPEQHRSRSIILATDNLLAGKPIFTLEQAGELASKAGIRVYGINPGDTKSKAYLADLATQYKKVVTSTGGGYFALDDPNAIPGIVDSITAEQAAVLPGAAQLVHDDEPGLLVILAMLGLAGLFAFAWRLRR